MSLTLSLTTKIIEQAQYTFTDALGNVVKQQVDTTTAYAMSYGQQANGVNASVIVPTKFYENRLTIPIASSVHDIDLTQLVDVYGNVLNFANIVEIFIHNNDASGGSGLLIGGAPSKPWLAPFNSQTSKCVYIPAGGNWVQSSPYVGFSVVPASSKILRITNDAASPTGPGSFDLRIYGI